MTNNESRTQPLVWTSTREWGSVGLTHRAVVEIHGVEWKFRVCKPHKRAWVVTASRGSQMALYREVKTLAEAKDYAQMHANLNAVSCSECGRISQHRFDCTAGR